MADHDRPSSDRSEPSSSASHKTEVVAQKPTRGKRRWNRFARRVGTIVLLLVLWLILAGASLAYGAVKAREGKTELTIAKDALVSSNRNITDARAHLKEGGKAMRAANRGFNNPLTWPLRAIPTLGTQIRSATALTHIGDTVGNATADGIATIDEKYPGLLVDPHNSTTSASTNPELMRTIGDVASRAGKKIGTVDLGPSEKLVGPLHDGRSLAQEYVVPLGDGLRRAGAGANGFASLMSDHKRYAFFAANTAEMHAGSGMFLSAGLLETGNGQLKLSDMKPAQTISAPPGSVTWPDQLDQRWGFLELKHTPQDLMMSPRFDVSAPIAADIWKKSQNTDVDGVMVADVAFLKAVLAATGPIVVDNMTFTDSNVIQQLNYEQYKNLDASKLTPAERVQLATNPEAFITDNFARRDMLTRLAGTAFDRIAEQRWNPTVFAREIAKAVDGRHFMVWSKDKETNAYWQQAWVSGELTEKSLMVNVINMGGNKLDQFLDTTVKLESASTSNGYDIALTITVKNNAPTNGPKYVIGPFSNSDFAAGQYVGLVSVSLPNDSDNAKFDSDNRVAVLGQDGPTYVIATPVNLKSGESKTYVLRWQRPKGGSMTLVEPSARIPSTLWTYGNRTWRDDHNVFLHH